jgi:hypothetical protein
MEVQPGRGEAATPMAQAASKRGQARETPAPVLSRIDAEVARKRSLRKQRNMLHE